ncbi:hypothetical protein AB0H76_36725 [Nocardia sp. NPDC050712]|uniref:hypothetical protein n=1 Tax=Nocardia sp. NPDC050712 TaxID=3155518 RepID=UPI0033CAA854
MLDDGATGLQYFAQLYQRYNRAFSANIEISKIYMRYDEQRGMDLEKLANTATAMRTTLSEVDAQLTTQKAAKEKLPTIWTGDAATAASTMFAQQLTMAQEDRDKAVTAVLAMETAIPKLRSAVESKKNHVKDLVKSSEVKVDDKTPDDIDGIIETAQGKEGNWTKFGQVMAFAATGGASSLYNVWNKDRCQDWLNDTFKKEFDEKLQNFYDKCTSTDTAVKQAYPTLTAAMQALDGNAYPRPAGTTVTSPSPGPSPGPSPSSPSPGPSPSSPSPTSPSPTSPSPTTPSPTTSSPTAGTPSYLNAAALSGLASTMATALTTAVSTLATVATAGLTALGTAISEAVEDLTDDDKDDDGKEDKKEGDTKEGEKKANSNEFDLAGKHYKLEVGADGQPKLVETDGAGKTQEYSVKLDSNGNPIISGEEKKEEKKSEDTPQTPSAGTPTSGMPAAAKPKKGGEDGEHTPKVVPVTGEQKPQEQPVQTGAELSEAGPL